MSYSTVDFDTVAPLSPYDKTASMVAGRGVSFDWSPPPDIVHSETPIETRRSTHLENCNPTFVDLTGIKAGRLTVIGIAAGRDQEKHRWVVRCQCGDYELRRAKIIKQWAADGCTAGVMCHECSYTQKLLRGEHNPKKAAAAAQAIQSMNR